MRRFSRQAAARAALTCAVLALSLSAAGGPRAERDSVGDALAGHRAEMQQLGEKADPMRRAMFFDPVDIESAPAGVPCDHLAQRRPEAIGGRGWVVLLQTRGEPKRLVRYWLPPPVDSNAAEVEAQARVFAAGRLKNVEFAALGVRSFAWCR